MVSLRPPLAMTRGSFSVARAWLPPLTARRSAGIPPGGKERQSKIGSSGSGDGGGGGGRLVFVVFRCLGVVLRVVAAVHSLGGLPLFAQKGEHERVSRAYADSDGVGRIRLGRNGMGLASGVDKLRSGAFFRALKEYPTRFTSLLVNAGGNMVPKRGVRLRC